MKNTDQKATLKYTRSRWAEAMDLTTQLMSVARRIRERRGIPGAPDYNTYRSIAHQLQASTHFGVDPPSYCLNQIPEIILAEHSYEIVIQLFEHDEKLHRYTMEFCFRFGKEKEGELYRVQLVRPDTLVTKINQYQRWAISELMISFFEVLRSSGFSPIDVADDQQYAWLPRQVSSEDPDLTRAT